MPVLTLDEISLAYGDVPLLDRVTLSLDIADRVALIGRNGTGKSSLLRVAAGLVAPDDGAVWRQPDVRVAYVAQEPELESAQTVFEAVARGLGEVRKVLAAYERIAHHVSEHNDVESLQQLETLGTELDRQDGWRLKSRVDAALSRLTLDANAAVGELSGGQKKRVALAQALVLEPEMLLLDEPTNHLDIDSIAWLEALLTGFRGALLFVTHDRAFLDAVAQRVIELDRGRLSAYPGNFSAYQLSKVEQLAVEATINAKFDAVLAQEEAWIRKGVEARRTRNAGRVRRLEALRRERAARRDRQATASIAVDGSERSGQLVAELSHVDKVFGERTVVKDFSARILRGDKVGLIGPNGAGKTTLLRLILGELAPDAGYVRRGTKLSVAYYDQFRAQLDAETTVLDTIGQGSDYIEVGGARKHVLSYLGDFLFSPQRVRSPVKALSGGERNRLLLARLFAKPANLIVLDEPTNDLDLETLELLEVLLQEYSGTVLLVSHDRTFLDNVVTQVIAWESDGRWVENPGGWQEWARVLNTRAAARLSTPVSRAEKLESGMTKRVTRPGKLSYQQAQELKTLPARIEALEQEQAALSRRLGDPDLYRSDADEVRRVQARYEEIEGLLVAVLERWTWLEQQQGG